MFRLHCAPNTISVAIAIACQEAGVDYEAVTLDFANSAQTKAPYLLINPKGRVPALETTNGILTETGAILEYVAPDLVPEDAMDAARVRELMYYLAGTMHVAHAHKMRGTRWANNESSFADMTAKVPETMAACTAYLEETLPFAPFATGAEITVADAYLYTVLTWLDGDKVDIRQTPKVAAYFTMMGERHSVQTVRSEGLL